MWIQNPRFCRISLVLGVVVASASAHALTFDDLGMGNRTFDDGMGNSSVVTIEHISSSSTDLDSMVTNLESQGFTVNRIADFDGTLTVNWLQATDYGINSVGHRVLGITWDATVSTPDALNLNNIIFNEVTPVVDPPFSILWYGDNSQPNYPFNPNPQYSDTDFDGNNDALELSTNYGWWMNDPGYSEVRYDLVGYIGQDGSINLGDGLKLTNTATIAPVPEPASLAAVAMGVVAAVRRRKSRSA